MSDLDQENPYKTFDEACAALKSVQYDGALRWPLERSVATYWLLQDLLLRLVDNLSDHPASAAKWLRHNSEAVSDHIRGAVVLASRNELATNAAIQRACRRMSSCLDAISRISTVELASVTT